MTTRPNPQNKVFIATSLDGYIADKQGGIEWLHRIPNPENSDMGYHHFMENIDALVMERTTFETVACFEEWPYQKPVFVLSNQLAQLPATYTGKAMLVKGTIQEVLKHIHQQGYYKLYIDGGKTIQSFLQEDLIDEMTITLIPVLLGGGIPLFGELTQELKFSCVAIVYMLFSIKQL